MKYSKLGDWPKDIHKLQAATTSGPLRAPLVIPESIVAIPGK